MALSFAPARSATTPVTLERYSVPVEGDTASGWLAYPSSGAPRVMLVYGHACCGANVIALDADLVKRFAAYDAVAVAMDFRGPGHWDVMKGHADVIAATAALKARFPSVTRTVLWGVSMGAEVTGMSLAERPDLFDYWVVSYGVTDLAQQYTAYGMYPGPDANDPSNLEKASWITAECGGTPATAGLAYLARSPDYLLASANLASLRHVYLFHGVGDLVVPYSESRTMFQELVERQVPVTLTTGLTGRGGTWGPYDPAGRTIPVLPTPSGPATHDARGYGASESTVKALLAGAEPDAGIHAREYLVDGSISKTVTLTEG
jgi:fermentation-respiration switch protein FrsA (DUF1100 family)